MGVGSLDVNKGPLRSCKNDEEIFYLEVPSLSDIKASMCFANNIRSDITFVVNLLK